MRSWQEARIEAERFGRGFVLVLDEIQKVPGWSETVKGLWDADRARGCPLRVVILGSAPLLMQSGLSESLAGRFELIRVSHWSFQEMAEAFDFDLPMYLYFGGYPGAAHYAQDERRWRSYNAAHLDRVVFRVPVGHVRIGRVGDQIERGAASLLGIGEL